MYNSLYPSLRSVVQAGEDRYCSDVEQTPDGLLRSDFRTWEPAAARRWRVDTGWWQRRVWREYFTLTTTSGMLVAIYHDVLTGAWRLQRLYD
jgi:hypothetical protein